MTDTNSEERSTGASSYDVSSMGSRDQSDTAISNFSVGGYESAGSVGVRSWISDRAIAYLSVAQRWRIETSWKFQGVLVLYHHVFLAMYALHPMWGPGGISYEGSVGKWALRLLGHGWSTSAEEEGILVGLAVTSIVLTVIHVSFALHIAWSIRSKKDLYPGERAVARFLEVFFIQALGLPALGVLLAPVTCEWSGARPALHLLIPGSTCTGSLMALGAASLPAALFLLLPLSLLLSVKEADIDPLSPVPWASASPTAAFRLHLLKAATLLSTHLLSGFSRALAASLSAAFLVWAAFIEVARLPYFGTVHSAVRAAVQGAIAVMFSVAALRDRWGSYHLVAAIGAPFVGLLCGSLAVIRLRHARRVVGRYFALRDDVAPASKRHHRFYDEEEPELLMRSVRKSLWQREVAEQDRQGLLAAITQASHVFPNEGSGHVSLSLAALHLYVLRDVQAAASILQKAKGAKCSLPVRITVLLLERVVRQRHNAAKGNTMDWATYVELQESTRLLIASHRRAVQSSRDIWRSLLRHDVGMDDIVAGAKRIRRMEVAAEGAYKAALERYPDQPRILSLYASFLEDVQGDAVAALRLVQKVEKLEEAAVAMGEDREDEEGRVSIDDARDGVCVIDGDGIITVANAHVARMFGYRRAEMLGRNVSMMMPAPFSLMHDRFLKSYISTRRTKILGTTRTVLGMRKEGTVFPITLCATAISQRGQPAFMGVIRSVDQGPRPCVLYLTPNGTAVAATPALVSLLSLPPSVLPGPAETLFSDHTHLSSLLVGPNITLTSATVLPTPQQVILRTNFGEDIPGTATVSVWGSDDQPILAMSFVSPGQDRLSVGVGASGEIVHCSPALETRLGRNAAALAGRNALEVIAEPVRTFLRGLSMSTSVVVGLDGRTVPLDKRGSIETWVRVTARQVEGAGTGEASVLLTLTPLDGGARPEFEPSLKLNVDDAGIVVNCETHGGQLQGAEGNLVGHRVNEVIRIEGPLSHHLDHWRSLPSPLTRHVSLSLATSIPATAIFSRTGTVTSVALFPHRALIVSLRLDPCLLLASFSGPAPLLFGRHPAAGTHVGDLLKWPGLNEAGDVGALMQALGGSRQKGGGMKRRDASGRQGGVEVRGVGGTMRTCAQAISASGGGAWVVVAAEDDWVPAALGEDMGDIADPEVRRGQDNGQRDRENVGWGGEEREEGEEKEEGMERSEEEKRGSEKGEASKWASNRVEEWVTQGGAVGRWLEDMAGVTDEKNSTESIEVEQEEEGEKEKERVGEDDAIVVTERIGDRRLLTSAGGIATEDPERPRSAESGASTESAVAGRGLATAIVVEAEMGAWEPQPAAVRGKRLKRIEALMQSSLRRPLRVLRLCLVGITTAIAAVHVAGFVAVMARAKEHDALLGWVDEAGLGLVRVAQVVMHVRVMQGQSVGLLVPGPLASFEVNRSALDSEIRKFLAAHASLYDTQSAFTGRWGRVLSSLWLDEDIDVLVPMSNDVDESNLAPSEMNLWALGNKFAADVLDIAGMSEESLSQTGDLARTGAFAFVSANGIDRLLIRYRLLRDALFDVAVANLGTIGATGLGFLVAEVGVIVPLAVGLLRWGLGGVGETRVRQAAALLAIPRAVVAELWRKEVRVGAEGEDEEEGQRRVEGRTGRWTGPGSRGSGSAVRAALGRKISEETIGVAMDLLQARRGHNRSQRRLQTRLTAPLLLWAAVDALLLGLTWQLQKDTATRLVPIKASHILLTQRPWTQEAALRLVMHVENSRLGLSRAQTDVEGARDALARASREMLKAAYGLIYGSEDLLGLYNIPGGTAFRVTALLPIFFDSACYAADVGHPWGPMIQQTSLLAILEDSSLCLDEDDPMYPVLQGGLSSMLVYYSDDAEMLAIDKEPAISVTNRNFDFIMVHGSVEMRLAQEQIHNTLMSFLGDLAVMEAIHVVLLLLTLGMCAGYATLVMRPIRELVEQEARTMASLLSEVPGELGVEEALVGMVMAIEREKGRKGAEEMEESVEERKEGAKVEEAPA